MTCWYIQSTSTGEDTSRCVYTQAHFNKPFKRTLLLRRLFFYFPPCPSHIAQQWLQCLGRKGGMIVAKPEAKNGQTYVNPWIDGEPMELWEILFRRSQCGPILRIYNNAELCLNPMKLYILHNHSRVPSLKQMPQVKVRIKETNTNMSILSSVVQLLLRQGSQLPFRHLNWRTRATQT